MDDGNEETTVASIPKYVALTICHKCLLISPVGT